MKYPFVVYKTQIEDHVFWAAESSALRSCVGQGDTIDEALEELAENETAWLEAAEELGMAIPPVPVEPMNEYSGKFTVRVAPIVHKKAAELAKKQGISLNQYINDAIVSRNSELSAINAISPEVLGMLKQVREFFAYSSTQSVASGSVFSYSTQKKSPYRPILATDVS